MSHRHRHKARSHPPPRDLRGVTLEVLSKELDTYSTAISSQIRTINIGVLGLSWLVLLRDAKVTRISAVIGDRWPLGVCLICVLALVLDLGQLLLAERMVEHAFNEAEIGNGTAQYDADSIPYRGQLLCYRLKIVLTFLAATLFVVLVFFALLHQAA